MGACQPHPIAFETLVSDPLTRAVMRADGVTPDALLAVIRHAQLAVTGREPPPPVPTAAPAVALKPAKRRRSRRAAARNARA